MMSAGRGRLPLIALVLVIAWAVVVHGQDSRPGQSPEGKPEKNPASATTDRATLDLIDQTDARVYRLNASGMKKMSCRADVKMSMKSPGFDAPSEEFSCRYIWDATGEKPTQQVIVDDGSTSPTMPLDELFRQLHQGFYPPWREEFAECLVVSSRDGKNTVLTVMDRDSRVVESLSPNGVESIVIDGQGLVREIKGTGMNMGGPAGGPVPDRGSRIALKLEWVKLGDQYAMSRISMVTSGSMAGTKMDMSLDFAEFGKYHAWSKISCSANQPGQSMTVEITFRDYAFDDEVDSGKNTPGETSTKPKSGEEGG